MAELKNLKFRITSPEQSKRLQKILIAQGYKWGADNVVKETHRPFLYTYHWNGLFFSGHDDDLQASDYFKRHENPEQDTESYIESYEERLSHNEDNMKAALAKPFKALSLEDAWDNAHEGNFFTQAKTIADTHTPAPWLDNMGECPVEDGSTLLDVMFKSGVVDSEGGVASNWLWYFEKDDCDYDIIKWRYHNSFDYFKAPKTPSLGKKPVADAPVTIDSHYNFNYQLTKADIEAGVIKIDPYFVAQQWKLGSKDDSGVIFHIMKNISRFGDKNTKEREIVAIYKSILRLGQLDGVKFD